MPWEHVRERNEFMSKIAVDTLKAGSITNDLSGMCNSLEQYSNSITDICNGLRMNSNVASAIKQRLRKNASDVKAESVQMRSLANTLQQIMELYEATENGIVNSSENSPKTEEKDWKDLFPSLTILAPIWILGCPMPWPLLDLIKMLEDYFASKDEDNPWYWHTRKFGNRTDKDDKNFWEAFFVETEADGWMDYDWEYGDVGIGGYFNGEAGAFQAKGETDFGKYVHGEGAVSLFATLISTRAGAQLFKDGKFQPGVYAAGKAEAYGAKGKGSGYLGTENNNVHGGVEGHGLYAGAKAQEGLGYLGKDPEGRDVYGAALEAGAEAYLATGEVKGGFSILGIDVDIELEGKLGGAGAEAGASVTNQEIDIGGSLGLGAGVGLKLSVDWSDFEMPEIDWPDWDWPW